MIKITDSKTIAKVDKKKKTQGAGAASGVDFAAMVASAGGSDDVESQSQGFSGGLSAGSSLYGQMEHSVPQDAEGRSAYMLDMLEELEKDILAGNPTGAVKKLKEALAQKAVDYDNLPPKLKELVDEIELRASLEVAKMEESK